MLNTKPTILLLITNLGKGGAQRVFYDQALALSEKYNVIEVIFDRNDERIYNTSLPLYDLDSKSISRSLGPMGRFYNRARILNGLVKKHKAVMVISHMDGANWVNSLSLSRAKKIFVVHGTVLHDLAQSATMQWFRKKLIIPLLYNQGDITVAVSEGIARELRIECSVKKIINIPNFFEIEQIEQKAAESLPAAHQNLFNDTFVLITSGRLARQKQQHFLFDVYKSVKKSQPTVRLVILGDGDERKNLIAQAQSAGLKVYTIWDERGHPFNTGYDVYFLGYVSNPYQYLNKSKLFLFPSAWEGFPLALCEAMISGVPVLASDCPTGPREILLPGSFDDSYKLTNAEFTSAGVLMPMPDKQTAQTEWSNAAADLLNNPQKCKALVNSAQLRMKEFGKDEILARWECLIKTLLNDPPDNSTISI